MNNLVSSALRLLESSFLTNMALSMFTSFNVSADVVTAYYHSWGFLSMSLGRCQPMFQELLLLLQPLSVLPFDLNLLLEPRLLRNRQLCPEEHGVSPLPPCSALLATSWPLLQADSRQSGQQTKNLQHTGLQYQETLSQLNSNCTKQRFGGTRANRSPCLAPIPEWWPTQDNLIEGLVEGENWSQISMESRREDRRGEEDGGTPEVSPCVQGVSPGRGGLRWAKLFGATDGSSRAEMVSQSHIGAQPRR